VDEGAECRVIAEGFSLAEGPTWVDAEGGYLLVSDIGGDRRCRWDERDGLRVVAAPTANANGMTLDPQGRLLVCEHSTNSVLRMDADGTGAGRELVASHYHGRELNSPNDVIAARDGTIYFTDPAGGRRAPWGTEREAELDFEGVYRVPPGGGEPELLGTFDLPNGLCLSPDESFLYVNETAAARILVFERQPGGGVSNGRVFASGIGSRELGTVDGMKCDEHGNVWVTAPGGIWIYDPSGERVGAVAVPERTLNFTWGGADGTVLFVTGVASVFLVETLTRDARRTA
jgi:gluconolactonase